MSCAECREPLDSKESPHCDACGAAVCAFRNTCRRALEKDDEDYPTKVICARCDENRDHVHNPPLPAPGGAAEIEMVIDVEGRL